MQQSGEREQESKHVERYVKHAGSGRGWCSGFFCAIKVGNGVVVVSVGKMKQSFGSQENRQHDSGVPSEGILHERTSQPDIFADSLLDCDHRFKLVALWRASWMVSGD